MKVPYWRLSGFYGLYFALIGCIVPFWGLYLQQQSFTAEDIGILLALFSAIRIFAPSLWASLAHQCEHFIRPIQLLRLAGLLMALCFMAIYWATEFWHFALIMVSYGFFWSAMLPQYETLTLNHIKDDLDAYSNIRLWGSVGFILIVSLLGWAFDYISIEFLPGIMLILMLVIVFNGLLLPEAKPIADSSAHQVEDPQDGVKIDVTKFGFVSFLLVTILVQASHGPYYVFFSIYLQQLDYSNTAIGLLWSLGVLAEIVLFWRIAFFIRHFSLRNLVIMSLLLTVLRWLLTAYFSSNISLLIFSQCLHAFSFGLLHAVSMKYISVFFDGKQLHGHALYSGLGFGLGGAIGAYVAGIAWLSIGASWVFIGAGGLALIAGFIAYIGLPKESEIR
jgi:MFS transporter, PPP family, 3-phenylpropionic acid transporter